jgi:hypothetical protein
MAKLMKLSLRKDKYKPSLFFPEIRNDQTIRKLYSLLV